MNILESLSARYNAVFIHRIFDDIKSINNFQENKMIFYSISSDLYIEALYYLFIEKDIKHTKQSFYFSGKMQIYLCLLYKDNDLFTISMSITTAVLLSDNKKLIQQYANLTYDTYEKDLKKGHLMPFVQAILRDDWDYLKEKIEYNKEHFTSKKSNAWFIPDLDFFEALLMKNEIKMKEAILVLLTPKKHNQRNKEIYRKDLISTPALTYIKLAYIKGYELDIDHPLIPKELLPVKPNDEYWEYDFMKEGKYKDV